MSLNLTDGSTPAELYLYSGSFLYTKACHVEYGSLTVFASILSFTWFHFSTTVNAIILRQKAAVTTRAERLHYCLSVWSDATVIIINKNIGARRWTSEQAVVREMHTHFIPDHLLRYPWACD